MKNLNLKLTLGLIVLGAWAMINIFAAKNENKVVITRTVSIDKNFSGLDAHAGMEITYTQNNSPSKAIIKGPKEIVEGITFDVNNNGVLTFNYPNLKKINGKVTITLNGKVLKNYQVSSSGIINVTTPVKVDQVLNFAASSSGKIILQKNVENEKNNINVSVSSSGEVLFKSVVKGNVINVASSSSSLVTLLSASSAVFNYSGSSVGILELNSLTADQFNISVSSGGGVTVKDARIKVFNGMASSGGEASVLNLIADKVNASTSSGGEIKLSGSCEEANMTASSGGVVNGKKLTIKNLKSKKTSSGGSVKL